MSGGTEENTSDRNADRPETAPSAREASASKSTADALREQQAIAAAMMIGESMRRDERSQAHTLARRLGIFMCGMAVFGLVVLFAFARFAGERFNPFPYMIGLGVIAAGSAVAAYWGYAESRRGAEE